MLHRRPHGSQGVKVPNRIVQNAPSFKDARKALVSLLENISFVKVVSVQMQANGIYIGEAIETNFSDARERPKLVFFDKHGRSKTTVRIGPISVPQAPLGRDHPAAVPTVGDILVGSLVPNQRKSHLELVLRAWSSDAKSLWELLRILKFGTKSSEFEARSFLIQSVSNLLQCPEDLRRMRDDVYMVARIILWGSLRPMQVLASIEQPSVFTLKEPPTNIEIEQCRAIRISSKASEFIDCLTLKLNDSAISESFSNGFEPIKMAAPQYGGGYGTTSGNVTYPMPYPMPMVPKYIGTTEYNPTEYNPMDYNNGSQTPIVPDTMYTPASPQYVPSSPPASPPYVPASPLYVPASPPYVPASPKAKMPVLDLYSDIPIE